ncbi:iron ABC transporter permease [Aliiroseovarius halocynthiae]|uniref:Iron ABC transporter permease n=2 Tax=Aliiroseovarius halocynthiae TaxID=985055 RepID=A0A545SW39_9RHOB|nr:iron ABC transporter permease [Aliiroseovarius halocynthiae]
MTSGPFQASPQEVLFATLGLGDNTSTFIVLDLRLPRALLAVFVGAGLALSGVIVQAICRNPLASPGTLGINAGASLGAVTVLVVFPDLPLSLLPLAAFGGGVIAATCTYAVGWTGSSSSTRLILAGVGVGVFFSALISVVMIFGKLQLVSQAMLWISGSIYGAKWSDVATIAVAAAVLVPLSFLSVTTLDVMMMGRGISVGLGCSVERDRVVFLLLAVALASTCIAVSGPIGFVGLMSPHIARMIAGSNHRTMLPIAAFTGTAIVQAADFFGRTALVPTEIPVGIYTAAVGAPFLIYLLVKR